MKDAFQIAYRVALISIALGFVWVDFYPRFGPPDFRYTGSDPAHHVFNLGWKLALFIYDSNQDAPLQWGPLTEYVLAFELLVLAVLIIAPEMLKSIVSCVKGKCSGTQNDASPPP
jgi:hypothetical protein